MCGCGVGACFFFRNGKLCLIGAFTSAGNVLGVELLILSVGFVFVVA